MVETVYEQLCQTAKEAQTLRAFSSERLRRFAEVTRTAEAVYLTVREFIGGPAGQVQCSPPHARSFTVRCPDVSTAHEIHPITGVLTFGISVGLPVDADVLYVGVWVLVFHDDDGRMVVQVEDDDMTFPASAASLTAFAHHATEVLKRRLGVPAIPS